MPSPARRARVPNTARTGPFTPSVRGLRLCRSYKVPDKVPTLR